MKNGAYGLVSLNGAPVDPGDHVTLFAGATPLAADAVDCLLHLQDNHQGATHWTDLHDGFCALLGFLDEPAQVAEALGINEFAGIAKLAAAAHARWGVDMASRLLGDWLMVRWQDAPRRLTLVMSETVRDPCYFATDGDRAAFAPQLVRLARLSWVDDAFAPDMLIRSMGDFARRRSMNGATLIRGIAEVRAGEEVVVDASGVRRRIATPLPAPPLRGIAFDDAVDELRDLLDQIVAQQLARASNTVCLLSGGLDSSLLAASAALLPGVQGMVCLTSVAPVGSGVADEQAWAEQVSAHLGMPMVHVTPDAATDLYQPSARTFAAFESPLQSPRHYLYAALEDAAVAQGADAMIDGMFGELTVSFKPHFGVPGGRLATLRRLAAGARASLMPRRQAAFADTSIVRLSPAASALLPGGHGSPPRYALPTGPAGAFGIQQAMVKATTQPTLSSIPALRPVFPFRDRRLVRLMASFPAGFATHRGVSRAPIRALLRNRVPRSVAERTDKLGFSPAHDLLLRQHASQALARLRDDPDPESAVWLDLAWLEDALVQTARGVRLDAHRVTTMQATAIAVEFFRWWRTARR